MRSTRFVITAIAVGLLLVPTSLFASGQKQGDSQGKVELTLMQFFGNKEVWQQIIDKYNESRSNIHVTQKVVTGGASTYQEVLKTGLASGTGPEAFFEWGGSLSGVIIKAGHALPLNKYYEQYGWEDQLIGWGLDKLKANSEAWGKKGDLYGVLDSTEGMTFWYNKQL